MTVRKKNTVHCTTLLIPKFLHYTKPANYKAQKQLQ